MNKLIIILLFFIGFSVQAQNGQPPKNTITYEGKEFFINGLNAPWHHFGGDFGTHMWWGALYDSSWFDNFFLDCSNHGVNVVRIWIHCDGRTSPLFTSDGTPYGVEPAFYLDMDDMFRRARKYGVMVMPCMWSFDMCKISPDAGPNGGGHDDLLTDDKKMEAYIKNVWEPIVKRYADQCNLFAWEVCNEPEWALDRTALNDTNWSYRTDVVVPIEKMQKLTGWMAAVAHKHSNKMVTTGSASIHYNSDIPECVGNWWSDSSLAKATGNMEGAYLDFYQVHYYDYMVAIGGDLYNLEKNTAYFKLDKPVIIGETPADPTKAVVYKADEVLNLSYQNGYAGLMYWSYLGSDGFGAWKDMKEPLKAFYEKHPEIVKPQNAWTCDLIKDEIIQLTARKEANNLVLTWKAEDPFFLSNFTIEISADGTKFTKWKTVPQKDTKTVDYTYKSKLKETAAFARIKQRNVYGVETTSNPVKIN